MNIKSNQNLESYLKKIIITNTQDRDKKVIQIFGEGPQNGKTIVVTGNLSLFSKVKLEEILKENSAKVTGQISGKTNYLICGGILEDGREVTQGNKFKTATQKKTKIVQQDDLDDWLQQNIQKSLADLFGDQFEILTKKPQQSQDLQVLVRKGETLTDRYKPMDFQEVVGNAGFVQSMLSWLKNFYDPKAKQEAAQQKKKFVQMQLNRFQAAGDAYSKACILSGPPGVGKSTLVRLLAQLQNIQIFQTNESECKKDFI